MRPPLDAPTAPGVAVGTEAVAAAPKSASRATEVQPNPPARACNTDRPAVAVAAGKFCSPIESPAQVNPYAPDLMQLREGVVGVKDYPWRAGDSREGAGLACLSSENVAPIQVRGACDMLDRMPMRTSPLGSTPSPPRTVPGRPGLASMALEQPQGEALGRPASSSRTAFKTWTGADSLGHAAPTNSNAEPSRRSGAVEAHHDARDARMEGPRGLGSAPSCSGGTVEHLASQIWADTEQSGPDFVQFRATTDFASGQRGPREQGGMREGWMDFDAEVVRGIEPSRPRNANPGKEATQFSAQTNLSAPSHQSAPDFGKVHAATNLAAGQSGSRKHGGTQEGHVGCGSRVERRAAAAAQHNAGTAKVATQQLCAAQSGPMHPVLELVLDLQILGQTLELPPTLILSVLHPPASPPYFS